MTPSMATTTAAMAHRMAMMMASTMKAKKRLPDHALEELRLRDRIVGMRLIHEIRADRLRAGLKLVHRGLHSGQDALAR